jgi:hypothetical protein
MEIQQSETARLMQENKSLKDENQAKSEIIEQQEAKIKALSR